MKKYEEEGDAGTDAGEKQRVTGVQRKGRRQVKGDEISNKEKRVRRTRS